MGTKVRRTGVVGALALVAAAGAAAPAWVLTLSELEVVPSEVTIASEPTAVTFDLEARMWTATEENKRYTAMKPDYPQVVWSDNQPWLVLTASTDHRATYTVAPNTVPGSTATVTVKVGLLDATTTISVVGAPTTSQDVVVAKYSGKAPAVAIVNGVSQANPGQCSTEIGALVGRWTIADLASPCVGVHSGWEAFVLDADHRAVFVSPGWTPGTNRADAAPAQGPPLDVPIALRIMVFDPLATTAAALEAERTRVRLLAQDEISKARGYLAESRAGITLSEHDTRVIPVSETVSFGTCAEGEHQTSSYDVNHVLHVYYVDEVESLKGLTCPAHHRRPRDVLYVSVDVHSPTTFIHELGHALGLTLPGQGHTDLMGGFDASNVMTSGDDDKDPVGRRRLTVGQVFRINADAASWLNRGRNGQGTPLRPPAELRLDCQCALGGPPGRCPAVGADVGRSSKATPELDAGSCSDQILYTRLTTTSGEDPVALVSGRRWRAPPGQCIAEVPSRSDDRSGVIYGTFENLNHPSGCPDWAAIFFTRHRPLYLEAPQLGLSPNSDLVLAYTVPPAPAVISVHLYYDGNGAGAVQQDTTYARRVFGEANRAGIDLAFTAHQSTGCPPTTAAPVSDVILCYRAGSGQEASIAGRRIEVRLGARKPSTAAHYLGRMLGLEPLPTAVPGFLGNIMREDPLRRGEKLTLGQVFRLHGTLSTTFPPRCDTGLCPSLDADIP
jgi:hypothetical protein